jgi:phenylpyruvate tautomerase PptA (4-oxalocrotonate tautomerase family)
MWMMIVIQNIILMDDDYHPEYHAASTIMPRIDFVRRNFTMPMIDVYAAADRFPAGSDRQLGEELTLAILRAEGVATPGSFHLNNTAAYIHRMDPSTVQTAATNTARTVRVQVVTPPAALTREGQKQLVKEVTEIVTKISGDPSQAGRTWVLLTEAAEGGWGLAGTAFGREEFAALAAKARAAT